MKNGDQSMNGISSASGTFSSTRVPRNSGRAISAVAQSVVQRLAQAWA